MDGAGGSKPMTHRGYFWALLLVLSILSCSGGAERSVVGRYRANHGKAEDLLVINEDSTWVRHFGSGDAAVEDRGSWERDVVGGNPVVVFHGFAARWDSSTRKGLWPARIETSSFGNLRLMISYDRSLYYERIDS